MTTKPVLLDRHPLQTPVECLLLVFTTRRAVALLSALEALFLEDNSALGKPPVVEGAGLSHRDLHSDEYVEVGAEDEDE